jgi:hypothetical protein
LKKRAFFASRFKLFRLCSIDHSLALSCERIKLLCLRLHAAPRCQLGLQFDPWLRRHIALWLRLRLRLSFRGCVCAGQAFEAAPGFEMLIIKPRLAHASARRIKPGLIFALLPRGKSPRA